MKPEQLKGELESLGEKLGYKIRYENGDFKGDRCHVKETDFLIVPKRLPAERQVTILARALAQLPLENVFLLPAGQENPRRVPR